MKVDDEAAIAAKKAAAKVMGFAQCVLLVFSIDLGGMASSLWQPFLLSGIKLAMVSFLTMSMGSFVLLLCLSELVGIVPFAGGNFGFVRCALGPFWGFMAASMEFLYYALFNSRILLKIAMLVEAAHEFNPDWQPLWAFLGMVFVLSVNLRGGFTFWGIMMGAALFTMAILMIFFVGTYSHLDMKGWGYGHNYAKKYHNNGYIGDGTRYMKAEFRVNVFYLGLDLLPLCSLRVKDESRVIPRALMTTFGLIFVIATLATIGVAFSYPGIHPSLNKAKYVLQFGLAAAIDMDPKRYPLLLMPPTIASGIGYMYASGNQLAAMAESGLMPKGLRPRFGEDQIPMVAMVVSAIMNYLVYFFLHHYEPQNVLFAYQMWSLATPGLFTLVCVAFIVFRTKFGSMKRNFVSPLGIPGAVFGVILWLHVFVINSHHRFQPNTKAIKAFYIFMSIMIVYYFGFVQFVQFFSKEEQEKFMKAYVLNANKMRKKQGGAYSYMAAMYRRTSAVTSFLGFGTSHHTSGHTGTVASKDAKSHASTAPAVSMAVLGTNKVDVEPFKPNSVKLSSRAPMRNSSLRASMTKGSVKVGWSGKALLSETESRRVFNLLNEVDETPAEATTVEEEVIPGVTLIEEFPEHFVPVLVPGANDDLAAAVAMVSSMIGDEEGGERGAEMVVRGTESA